MIVSSSNRLTRLACSFIFLSCLSSCTLTEPLRTEPFESGVLVYEARTLPTSASVSFLNRQTGFVRYTTPKSGILPTDIYNNQNNRLLNNTVTSYAEVDGKGFLVLSGRGQIEVVQASTFRNISLLSGVEQPRYVVGASPLKAYVSCWGGQTMGPNVSVIDVVARQIRGFIPLPARPEQLVVVNDELFVANPGDSTNVNRTVSLINTTTDQLVTTIPVGDAPTSMVYDAQAKLIYVLCHGRPVNSATGGLTTAELVTINPATRQVIRRVTIGGRAIPGNPTNLSFDPQTQTLYFLFRGMIHKTGAAATAITIDQPLQTRPLLNYGFDPVSGLLYGAASNRSTRPGVVLRFRPTGALVDSLTTEAIPTGFYFK